MGYAKFKDNYYILEGNHRTIIAILLGIKIIHGVYVIEIDMDYDKPLKENQSRKIYHNTYRNLLSKF